MQALSIVGAKLRLLINGKPFGICTALSYSADVGRRSIYGIDNYLPQELAPSQVSITGNLQCVRIKLDGGLEGRGIAVSDLDIMAEKYIQITVVDRETDTIILNINKAAINDQSWRSSTGSIMRGSFSFTGISWNQFLNI